jgi:hypothetical protein
VAAVLIPVAGDGMQQWMVMGKRQGVLSDLAVWPEPHFPIRCRPTW